MAFVDDAVALVEVTTMADDEDEDVSLLFDVTTVVFGGSILVLEVFEESILATAVVGDIVDVAALVADSTVVVGDVLAVPFVVSTALEGEVWEVLTGEPVIPSTAVVDDAATLDVINGENVLILVLVLVVVVGASDAVATGVD